jgi:hypothetical protein
VWKHSRDEGQVGISAHAGWIGGGWGPRLTFREDSCYYRETREEWPLLTVETEVSAGDSKSTNKRGPSLVGSLDSSCRFNIFLTCLGCSTVSLTAQFFSH